MFFKRKEAVQTLEFNHAYEEFQNNMNIILLCVDDDLKFDVRREFDSCLHFFTNQIAQNVDYINAFEFFYCQICENNCTNMG